MIHDSPKWILRAVALSMTIELIFRFVALATTIEVMAVVLCVILVRNERNRTYASIERNFVPK